MLNITVESVVSTMTEDKNSYFSTINIMQVLLFCSEILLLVIIFPTLIFPFFTFIKNQLIVSIELISILQLNYIIGSTYITNFLKSRQWKEKNRIKINCNGFCVKKILPKNNQFLFSKEIICWKYSGFLKIDMGKKDMNNELNYSDNNKKKLQFKLEETQK